ncbi:SGNH/GDSL hydrolase family protein [Neobacillus citreus]|uniref:SGNH/GDSL hydrolase family protein n=1 Tax=Neobacillus citreus TaxID=2833578 RepID=A0A942TAJ8_9BACI|nr:hypothetical protein [Neobacillus citreus]MCH6269423.1 hypothetical protein [Neobacillus citreus]
MQKVLTALLAIVFILVVYMGQSHWSQKIDNASAKDKINSTIKKSAAKKSETNVDKEDTKEQKLLAYTKNWPAEAVERFKQVQSEGKAFKILFVGSKAIGSESDGTFPIVKQKLVETFGEKNIQVTLKTYSSTSSQFVNDNKQKEISGERADLIIFEPFILQNNGFVSINKTLSDLAKVIKDVKAVNPETSFILQPAFPLYKAKIYPGQVAELKDYAEKNKIAYLDHWTSWPDPNTIEISKYLLPDQSAPSEKGVQAWSQALIQYLISQ